MIAGGIMGYVKAGSIASIATSSTFGIIIIINSIFILKGKLIAEYIAFFTVLALDAVFWWRYYASGNFMPSGLMLVLSTVVVFIVYFNLKKRIRDTL